MLKYVSKIEITTCITYNFLTAELPRWWREDTAVATNYSISNPRESSRAHLKRASDLLSPSPDKTLLAPASVPSSCLQIARPGDFFFRNSRGRSSLDLDLGGIKTGREKRS
ncbi:hypothetical protein PUN28_009561 [Cardiocondyla obscurior]|uniref:Uncharacterized protein n=1 Tax=Cardiocondyla obscurior TaxID=286306 RepID=A0AAW2FUH1_9HYME